MRHLAHSPLLSLAFGLALAVATAAPTVHAQAGLDSTGLDVVLPTNYDRQPGTYWSVVPFNYYNTSRAQFVYDSSSCDQREPLQIRAIAFRLRSQVQGQASWTFDLDVSTSRRSVTSLYTTFDQNHGPDKRRLFSGTISQTLAGSTTTPQPFEIQIPFSEPFTWNPAAGPLVLDFRMRSRSGPRTEIDAMHVQPGDTRFFGLSALGNPDASTARTPTNGYSDTVVIPQLLLADLKVPSGATSHLPSGSNYPFGTAVGTGARAQMIYSGSRFLGGRRVINRLGFRPDGGQAYTGRSYNMRVTMSTGPTAAVSSPSSSFAQNTGRDATVVFDGIWTTPSVVRTTSPAFTLELPLHRGFDYDPAGGPLVIDVQMRDVSGAFTVGFDGKNGTTDAARVIAVDPNATTGTPGSFGLALAVHGTPARTFPANYLDGPQFATNYPFGSSSPMRVQNVYDGAAFGLTQPFTITHLSWRAYSTEMAQSARQTMVRLATSPRPVGSLSTVFDENLGPDARDVFAGTVCMPYQDASTGRVWFTIELSHPFRWNPAYGPLVVDIRTLWGFLDNSPGASFDLATGPVARVAHTGDPYAANANYGPQDRALALELGGYGHNGIASSYGQSCGSPNGNPVLTTRSTPSVGDVNFAFRARQLYPSSVAVLGIGTDLVQTPLDGFGFPGCTLQHSLDVVALPLTVPPSGVATVPMIIRPGLKISGVHLFAQALCLDPTAPNGLTASQGMHLVFAD